MVWAGEGRGDCRVLKERMGGEYIEKGGEI